jgi:glutamine synthetase
MRTRCDSRVEHRDGRARAAQREAGRRTCGARVATGGWPPREPGPHPSRRAVTILRDLAHDATKLPSGALLRRCPRRRHWWGRAPWCAGPRSGQKTWRTSGEATELAISKERCGRWSWVRHVGAQGGIRQPHCLYSRCPPVPATTAPRPAPPPCPTTRAADHPPNLATAGSPTSWSSPAAATRALPAPPVHRHLGVNKNVEIPRRRSSGRRSLRRHHVRRLVDRGVRAHRGVGHAPCAPTSPRSAPAVGGEARGAGGAGSSATSPRPTARRSRPTRVAAQAADRARGGVGYTMMTGWRRVLPLQGWRRRRPTTETHDVGGYFDLAPVGPRRGRPARDGRRAAAHGLRGSRPRTTRSRTASTRSTSATPTALTDRRQHRDLPLGREARRAAVRARRVVHAQARSSGRTGAGCTRTSRSSAGRENAFFDPKAEWQLSRTALPLHRRAAAHAAGCARSPTRCEQLQAAGARLRGAGERRLEHAQPLADDPRPRPPRGRHARRAAHPDPAANPYLALPSCSRGPRRRSRPRPSGASPSTRTSGR